MDKDIQKRPRKKWTVVAELGTKGGGVNGGIAKVKDSSGKVYIEKRFKTEDVKHRFAYKEVVLLKQLKDHRYITRMVDHFIEERSLRGSVYLEYCSEGSLADFIKQRKQEGRYVREITAWNCVAYLRFLQIMDALSYIHFGPDPGNKKDRSKKRWNEIWHRDIKPANILLNRTEGSGEIVVKLADFGCSVSYASNWETKSRAREAARVSAFTKGFQPPESPNYTSRSDVWQLAACVVCLCCLQTSPSSSGESSSRPVGRRYSKELNDAISMCMKHEDRRPMPDEALKQLEMVFEKLEPSFLQEKQRMASPVQEDSRQLSPFDPRSSPGKSRPSRPPAMPHASSAPAVPTRDRRRDLYRDTIFRERTPRSPPWPHGYPDYPELDGW